MIYDELVKHIANCGKFFRKE